MKVFGWVLFVIGALCLLVGFTMDTTVSSYAGGGQRIHNIGLLAAKQNTLLSGVALAIVGAIFIGIGKSKKKTKFGLELAEDSFKKKCQFCAELIQNDAVVCRFCGRDVGTNAPTQAVKKEVSVDEQATLDKYGIRFERGLYCIGIYEHATLEEAVAHANNLQGQKKSR